MEVSITNGKITTKLAFYQSLPTFFHFPPIVFFAKQVDSVGKSLFLRTNINKLLLPSMNELNDFFATLSGYLWSWPTIVLLLGTHIFAFNW